MEGSEPAEQAAADPVADEPRPTRLRSHLKLAAGALASVAAVGAVIGGLAGYLNAWTAIRSSFLHSGRPTAQSAVSTISRGPTVTVPPIANDTGDPAQDAFASGLTQETIAALSRFRELRVVAQSSSPRSAVSSPIASSATDYSVDGEIRKGADATRVTFLLTDTHTGARVWSKTFSVKQENNDLLLTQDEIAGRAAAMIGSLYGAIASAEYFRIQGKPLTELTPYECIVQGLMVVQSPLPEPYIRGRTCLETLVVRQPSNAAAWATLAHVYRNQRHTGIALPPDETANPTKRTYLLDKELAAATKAVDLAPNDDYAHRQLARAYVDRCDRDKVWAETRRTIEINPNDASAYGSLGNPIANFGDWDAGAAMAAKGIEMLAPQNPRWWWQAISRRHFIRGEFQQAYEIGLKHYMEQDWRSHLDMAATLAMLERASDARVEISKLHAMKPGFTVRDADANLRLSCFDPAYREKSLDALRKAGLAE